ncbi:ATP-binding protein [Chitinophaga sp. Cy-1792]|uniref:ATP-binding protein n=1 Tax=Chitinophaga sp. Cy-1792 TaxID=2608339 RepID=UPI0014205182|nr:ATP-binding protein [Chitinophaga sp. Cy-1792]NIG54023.1 response regulator [Chitinophaga sp. Cy-1792]
MLASTVPALLPMAVAEEEIAEIADLQLKLTQLNSIMDTLCSMHQTMALHRNPGSTLETFLYNLMSITESECGFVGEVKSDGTLFPSIITHAISHANWVRDMKKKFGKEQDNGLRFLQMETLARQVIKTELPILNNNPLPDEQSMEFADHIPRLRSFIGIPVLYDKQLIGIIGLGNKPGGYSTTTYDILKPLVQTYAILLFANNQEKERNRIEKANRRMTSDLEALVTTLDDIVFELNENKIFTKVWCNNERLLFKPKDQVLNRPITEVMGELATIFDSLADTVLGTGEPMEYEYKDIRQDINNWYRMKMSLITADHPDAPKRLLILVKNISRRKMDELALQQAKAELERNNHLLNISQQMGAIGGWEFNTATSELFWTKQIYDLREVPYDHPISLATCSIFYHPDDRAIFEEHRKNLFENHKSYCLELRHVSANGTPTWVKTVGMPIFTNGKISHFRGIIMDITNQKVTELELVKAKEFAEKAATSRSEFLSVMSHEIRTPLNAIIGIAGILEDNHHADNTEVVHSLQFSANHLLGLINDILDFSKIEAGKIELEHIPVNLNQLIHGIAGNFQPLAKGKGIKLFTALDHELPPMILGDPVRLSQILNNLVNNAIKFTSKGSVCIEVHQEERHGNRIHICFTVRDTGIGIPAALHDRIFETFSQADAATARQHGGTGLGLAITKKLVEIQRGHITLDSAPGKGSAFSFTLGFEIPVAHPVELRCKQWAPGFLEGMNLLVVEDNIINIRILEMQLKKSGAGVTTATNGKQALERLKEQTFDGIILDLHMPEMNGYEAIPHIKMIQPDAFIIVLTADIMPEVAEKLSMLHVTDLLPKPYAAADLYKALAHHYA